MSRITRRDAAVVTAFSLGALAVAALGLAGYERWALALLGILTASVGVVSRLNFISRRRDLRSQRADVRALKADVRRARQQIKRGVESQERQTRLLSKETRQAQASFAKSAEAHVSQVGEMHRSGIEEVERQLVAGFRGVRHEGNLIGAMKDELSAEMLALRSELRGMRVAQQLMSQTVSATRNRMEDSIDAAAVAADDVQGLHQLFGRYMPTAPLPSMGSSRLRATGAFFATDLIERERPSRVRYVGGLSTAIWIAYAMRHRDGGAVVFDVCSEPDAEEARSVLETHGVGEAVTVRAIGQTSKETPEDGDPDPKHSLGGRVDLLILDIETAGVAAPEELPTTSDLEQMLAEEAVIIIAAPEEPERRRIIQSWQSGNAKLSNLPSPRADIAVIRWCASMSGPTSDAAASFSGRTRV